VQVMSRALVFILSHHLESDAAAEIPLGNVLIAFYIWEVCNFELPSAVLVRAVQPESVSSREDSRKKSKKDCIAASDILLFLQTSITTSEVEASGLLSSHRSEIFKYVHTELENQVVLLDGQVLEW